MVDVNRTETILVIDDEHGTLSMLRLLLGALGYSVFTADSGEKGLKIFRDQSPPIVLTDIRMPGMDGMEVLKQIKQIDGDAEVIVITGHGDMDMAVQALHLNASDFINKPIQKQALEVALRRAREKIRLKRQLRDYTRNLEVKVEEATAELARSCRRLQTLYEISRSVGETATLEGIIALLQERIESITRLRCHALLALNSQRKAIVTGHLDPGAVQVSETLTATVRDLQQPRPLSREEWTQIFPLAPLPANERIMLLPMMRSGEPSVGAALLGIPEGDGEDELQLVSLLLAEAVGGIRRAVAREQELEALRQITGVRDQFGSLIGRHVSMRQIYKLVLDIADSSATVLIQGESGTGKELIARRVHELSARREGPFVVINCAAYPQTLLESELFGHEKGAFTGATHTRRGCFELAHGGTIFLDEIGEIPPAAQVKLLRVIQFKEFQRIGGEATIRVDVRVLAATSKNLRREMEQGTFREDLYYRLHVIPIMMPPLRERMSDLPLLAVHFLSKFSERAGRRAPEIKPAVMDVLLDYRWPGNIRELENVMEHASILARGGTIGASDLPEYLKEAGKPARGSEQGLDEVEKQHLIRILEECQGNKIRAARRLKISRSTLYRKLEAYKLIE